MRLWWVQFAAIAVLAVVLFANGVFDETIQELKSRRRFGDENTRKRDTVTSARLVTVHKREPINRVIDRLRKLDDHDFDKSVQRSGCGFDKGMR